MRDWNHVHGDEWCGSMPHCVAPPEHNCHGVMPERHVEEVARLTESMVAFTWRYIKEDGVCTKKVVSDVTKYLVRKLLA